MQYNTPCIIQVREKKNTLSDVIEKFIYLYVYFISFIKSFVNRFLQIKMKIRNPRLNVHCVSYWTKIYLRFFLRKYVTFYDAVSMIHDVITTANPFPDTAKFMFFGVRNNNTQHIRC